MGLFDKLFRENKNEPNNPKAVNSRYTVEMLSEAYANMWYHREIAMLTIPANNPNTDEVELYFYTPNEIADSLIKDFFAVFPKIDVIVQENDRDNYDITYFNIYDERIEIGYFGNKVNTNFEVKVFRKDEQWYCTEIGMKKFNPPECIEQR